MKTEKKDVKKISEEEAMAVYRNHHLNPRSTCWCGICDIAREYIRLRV